METPYSLNNPVFCNFLFYGTVLVLNMVFVAIRVSYFRTTRKISPYPEDQSWFGRKGLKPPPEDPDIEHTRRCHLNDIENIIPFMLLGLLYVSIMPSPAMALLHFRIFTIARLIHTFVYILFIPLPARGICFVVGLTIIISMAIQILKVAVI